MQFIGSKEASGNDAKNATRIEAARRPVQGREIFNVKMQAKKPRPGLGSEELRARRAHPQSTK